METKIKKRYTKPIMKTIIIDKDISLIMQSNPGGGDPPDWGNQSQKSPKHRDPYKSPFN
ncbi:MAG: hypothetical protein Q8880_05840 [Bacteroidota bacterium]|nr:hypothetical protein [Bacteroidota bacterium]